MAMRMPPQTAQQPLLPDINRASLVLFSGLALIALNLFWVNGSGIFNAIFHHNDTAAQFTGITDTGLQVLGLALLTMLAQYGGENAGTAALMFVGALWILWLLAHFGTHPASEPAATSPTESTTANTANTATSGGSGGQKK